MDWREKIERLLRGLNAASHARKVGLPPSSIGAAVTRENEPNARKAVKITRALGVNADWLFDDEQDWPPPKSGDAVIDNAPDIALLAALDRRARYLRGMCDEAIKQAREIASAKGDHPLSSEDREALIERMRGIATMAALGRSLARRLGVVTDRAIEASELLDGLFGTTIGDVLIESATDQQNRREA